MRIKTLLYIIILLFLFSFIVIFLLYAKAYTLIMIAEIQMDRAELLVRALNG